MYLCDCIDIYFANSKKKNNQEIPSNQRNFSSTVQQCTNLFDSKKLFSGCEFTKSHRTEFHYRKHRTREYFNALKSTK